jgi:hypothetical protein
MRPRACLALVAALLTASCGVPLMTLPSGQGAAAADGAEALAQALAACTAVTTISAEVGVSGKVNGRRARGRLLAGLSAPASAYLDAPAPFGASAFIFAAVENDATLLLPRDHRVLQHGHPADVLEAVTGVALGPADLRAALTGCADGGDGAAARALNESWRLIPGTSDRYLRRDRAVDPWRLVVVVHHETGRRAWRAEYRDFADNLPRTIRLSSVDGGSFDLQLRLSQVELNVPLAPDTFQPQVPAGYAPMTIEELRAAGPLAEAARPNE